MSQTNSLTTDQDFTVHVSLCVLRALYTYKEMHLLFHVSPL